MSPTPLPVAPTWWAQSRISPDITLLREPWVTELLRCNVWHVRGKRRDLVIDSGLGVAPLLPQLDITSGHEPVVVLTHTHADHVGGWHEFPSRWLHEREAGLVDPDTSEPDLASLWAADLDIQESDHMRAAGYELPDCFLTAVPHHGFNLDSLPHHPAVPTRLLREGDVIDLGDRAFEVLHLPGHSPGSIGLYESREGLFFSGDAVYDGPLLDELAGSDIGEYIDTMRRLTEISIQTVLPGHGEIFGEQRLREITSGYLHRRDKT